jgi:hypothetical protein
LERLLPFLGEWLRLHSRVEAEPTPSQMIAERRVDKGKTGDGTENSVEQ